MSKQENIFYKLDKFILRNSIKYKIVPAWMVRWAPAVHIYIGLPLTLIASIYFITQLGGFGIFLAFILLASYIPNLLYKVTQKKILHEIENEKSKDYYTLSK